MLMHVTAHSGYINTVSESALDLTGINPFQHWGIEPDSVLCLAFWSDNYVVPVLAKVDIFAHTKT